MLLKLITSAGALGMFLLGLHGIWRAVRPLPPDRPPRAAAIPTRGGAAVVWWAIWVVAGGGLLLRLWTR